MIISFHVLQYVAMWCNVVQCFHLHIHCLSNYSHIHTVLRLPSDSKRCTALCNRLQHTATYCSTLQHNATHSDRLGTRTHNTLHRSATHCHTLQHTAKCCSALPQIRHSPLQTHGNTLQHTATHYSKLQHTATDSHKSDIRHS